MDTQITHQMDASPVAGMIQLELETLMLHGRRVGRRLIVARAHGGFAVMCERNQISEPHAQLLISIAERDAELRAQGMTELEAVSALASDCKLLNQLLAHTAQMIEGMQ